jgi:hypothetical protein
LGLGWGNAFKRKHRFGLLFDIGVVPQGAPRATLTASGALAANPTFQADLERERAAIEHSLRAWRLFPVLTFGTSFRF